MLRQFHQKEHQESRAHLNERLLQVKGEREALLNQKEGEFLSIEDLTEIYMQVMAEYRQKENFSLQTKSKTGEIQDYLEVRRPFGAAQ